MCLGKVRNRDFSSLTSQSIQRMEAQNETRKYVLKYYYKDKGEHQVHEYELNWHATQADLDEHKSALKVAIVIGPIVALLGITGITLQTIYTPLGITWALYPVSSLMVITGGLAALVGILRRNDTIDSLTPPKTRYNLGRKLELELKVNSELVTPTSIKLPHNSTYRGSPVETIADLLELDAGGVVK